MPDTFTDQEVAAALETCAAEPVHIPGCVQPFGCLLGINAEDERILYASENCETVIGHSAEALLGKGLGDVFGRKLVHDIKNGLNQLQSGGVSAPIGTPEIDGRSVEGFAFPSGPCYVVEVEPEQDPGLGSTEALQVVNFLMRQIQDCEDEQALLKLTVRLMRHLTRYDRVMAYRFDSDFNGEVRAEALAKGMEPFLGLRFPHWDIPAQARAIMAKLPLRFIEDANQTPAALLAEHADLPPLDITFAACRGVSPVHMQYLQNMGSRATMTLSIVDDGKLWGMLSFHHRSVKTPPAKLREVLTSFAEIFTMKLKMLRQQARLELVAAVDQLKTDLLQQIQDKNTLEEALPNLGPMVQDVLDATGTMVVTKPKVIKTGRTPSQPVIDRLVLEAKSASHNLIAVNNLCERYPDMAQTLDGCAGALVVSIGPERAFCIFRSENAQSVSWAGNPDKTIERVDGKARLEPRGSFSTYLEEVKNTCKPWSDLDIYFAQSIWALVNAAERQALTQTLNRQQKLMIDELNHRVRNILALVRSVSKQARRRYGSLASYAKSIESRIMALAAAHDIASGSNVSAVEITGLIRQELQPYLKEDAADITGPEAHIRADIAPIFALVIHELVTNAAKYGALSNEAGRVSVTVSEAEGGIGVHWRETGGPVVSEPEERGFGSILIESAVRYELGGESDLSFLPEGVQAHILLPTKAIEAHPGVRSPKEEAERAPAADVVERYVAPETSGPVLIVEDNFIIAQEMMDQIEEFGFGEVEICGNCPDALAYLGAVTPDLAILDVNLGGDQTSMPIALRLKELGVPFFFVTGYGDALDLPEPLKGTQRLTKPVSDADLNAAIAGVMGGAYGTGL